jgi:NTE family protein
MARGLVPLPSTVPPPTRPRTADRRKPAAAHVVSRRGLLIGGSLAAAGLAGCTISSDADHAGPDAPRDAPLARPVRTAWVFSSGGPRGFVHVGVVKALDELGLVPDLIVGASVGALVAVLRAAGKSGTEIAQLALDLKPALLTRVALDGDAWLSAAPLGAWVRQQIGDRPLERLPIAVGCVVHRPRRGDSVAFTAGDAGLAVQAASAIEGQFAPVRIRGELHQDADLHLPLPVRLARSLGAQRVLAVDASAYEEQAPPGSERYRAADLRKRALTEPDARAADVLLHPDTGYWAGMSREYRERSIAIGYSHTLAAAARLRALHAR